MYWEISDAQNLVEVRGIGVIDRMFMASFRAAKLGGGAASYRKLFDLSRAGIQLSDDDLHTLVENTRLTGPAVAGPIALVVGRSPLPLLLDMAVLTKLRIGERRRIRVFREEREAKQWLSTEPVSTAPRDALFPAWLSSS